MERTCDNCKYEHLDVMEIPCRNCYGPWKEDKLLNHNHWEPNNCFVGKIEINKPKPFILPKLKPKPLQIELIFTITKNGINQII